MPTLPLKPNESIEGERRRGTGLKNDAATEDLAADAKATASIAASFGPLMAKMGQLAAAAMLDRMGEFENKLKEGRSHQ